MMIHTHSGLVPVGRQPAAQEVPAEKEIAPDAWIDSRRRRRNDLWAIRMRFDWGTSLLWSGYDKSFNGPNGDLLPILFRSRKAGREWLKNQNLGIRAAVVKTRFVIVP